MNNFQSRALLERTQPRFEHFLVEECNKINVEILASCVLSCICFIMPKTRSTTMEPVESEETLMEEKSGHYKCNQINVQNSSFTV
ncbi:hypothetical protein T4B_6001 [Trichinella pseudospiralis]|uniref:Uncharacterized protein n=1 Tax=Trichinella pseudospiralis TaxID=6337 RepID=A0A0V1EZ71_TRIPS|nr:hypothetical protein T4A_6241 [Trichinella pseudospiralis]KRZ34257.1 hypothetical protein T4B_6001 [Trichinella pseudospiralis]KRZ45532.1 hypothetical protein T4C_9653 [Trichinella pseudospiralis]